MSQSSEWHRAAEQLKLFLESGRHVVSFERGPDPPDIIFHFDGESWGVEHTRLFQYVQGSDGELGRWAWDASALRLEGMLNTETEGSRKTGWVLAIFGPFSNKTLREIFRVAVEAIKKDDPEVFRDKVYPIRKYGYEPLEDVTLERYEGDKLVHVASGLSSDSFVPGSGHRSSEVKSRVDYAIKRILDDKAPKARSYSYSKKVLLIENLDLGADANIVVECLATQPELASAFDLIFLASEDSVRQVLRGVGR